MSTHNLDGRPMLAARDDVRRQVAAAAAILVTGAGWIHLLAAEDHRAHLHLAAFFLATAGLQLGWAALVVRRASAGLLKNGLAGNGGLVILWVVSRTTGVPFVPDIGEPEPIGITDAAASALELIAVAALAVLPKMNHGKLPAAAARLTVAGATALAVLLVIPAGLAGTPHEHKLDHEGRQVGPLGDRHPQRR